VGSHEGKHGQQQNRRHGVPHRAVESQRGDVRARRREAGRPL
jgi:hypothetical protein